jgi:hypothetical protein
MSQKHWLFSIAIALLIISAGVFLITGSYNPVSSPNLNVPVRNETDAGEIPIAFSDTGRPCSSNEEWHRKADQTGAWIDGALIDPEESDTEIRSILLKYNITASEIRVSPPHVVGYYVTVPDTEYQESTELIENNKSWMNVSLSSPMYEFTRPFVKTKNNSIPIPVVIIYSHQMNETMTYQDLVNRNIPIKKANVIEIDIRTKISPSDRERLLVDLSRDQRILSTYKAYLEGVLC